MSVDMKGKDLISIHDLTPEEVAEILKVAEMMKLNRKIGVSVKTLTGKSVSMIFQKPSTRTRITFELGVRELGGHPLYLRSDEMQLSRGETLADTGRVLSRYVNGIVIRTYKHDDVVELADYASVPVINALSDLLHPCQALSDLFTIQEKKGRLQGLKLAFIGDGNNIAHSLMFAGAKTGMNVTIATPKGYEAQDWVVKAAKQDAKETGAVITCTNDPIEAVEGADVVYTDVWVSMGQEKSRPERMKAFQAYQVDARLMKYAKPDAIFMHDLPAHRGEEVTDEVIDGPQSVVWDQAENRLHVQKAILSLLI